MRIFLQSALAMVVTASGFLLAAAAEPPAPLPEGKNPPTTALAPLEGTYSIVSGEKDGIPIPEERLIGSLVVITKDKIFGADKEKNGLFAVSYSLNATWTPWVIKMKRIFPKGEETLGLVKKEGDVVTLVYALPGGDAPNSFRSGDKQHLFVLKSLNAKDKQDK